MMLLRMSPYAGSVGAEIVGEPSPTYVRPGIHVPFRGSFSILASRDSSSDDHRRGRPDAPPMHRLARGLSIGRRVGRRALSSELASSTSPAAAVSADVASPSLGLDDDLRQFQEVASQFAANEMAPHAAEWRTKSKMAQ